MSKHLRNLLRFSFRKDNFFTQKKKTKKQNTVETTLVATTDSSNARCFDLRLRNIFPQSTKTQRWTYIMFKLTLFVYLLLWKIYIYNEDKDVKI